MAALRRHHDSARRVDLAEARRLLDEGHDIAFVAHQVGALSRHLSRALWNTMGAAVERGAR